MWWLLSTSRLANPYNLIFIFQIHIDENSQNKSSTIHVYEFLVIPKRNMPSVTDIRFHLASEHIAEPSMIKASKRNVTTTTAMGTPTITFNPWITSQRSGRSITKWLLTLKIWFGRYSLHSKINFIDIYTLQCMGLYSLNTGTLKIWSRYALFRMSHTKFPSLIFS